MSSGQATYISPKINGVLEGIFVDSDKSIQVDIILEDMQIEVFSIPNIQGSRFIPVRLGAVDSEGVSFRDTCTKWVLNDKLRFEVKGATNANVNFTVRYC